MIFSHQFQNLAYYLVVTLIGSPVIWPSHILKVNYDSFLPVLLKILHLNLSFD